MNGPLTQAIYQYSGNTQSFPICVINTYTQNDTQKMIQTKD